MRISPIASAIAAGLLISGSAMAVSNLETSASIQFSFTNPGARSLGLAGAFTGLADDATAAYSNPAGLTILQAPELAMELRSNRFSTQFVSGGSYRGNPFDGSGLQFSDKRSSVTNLGYLSYVKPTDFATFAFFFHRLADYQTQINAGAVDVLDSGFGQIVPYQGNINLSIKNVGMAMAKPINDSFSIGASLQYSSFDIDTITVRDFGGGVRNAQAEKGSDNDIAATLGAHYKANDQWTFGAAYRYGGSFKFDVANAGTTGNVSTFTTDFRVPHVISLGAAYRATENFKLAFDVNQIGYSRISDNLIDVTTAPINGRPVRGAASIKDGTELRLGGEYLFADFTHPFFVRGGIWRDPDHRLSVRATNPAAIPGVDPDNAILDAGEFRPDDAQIHYALGIGWAFDTFQLDAGLDLSKRNDTIAVSGVWRF
jgi:long-chain fatty acid transport protein